MLSSGLSCLHKAGFVHGDVKPTNLMWSPDGGVLRVIDYGLSFHKEDKVRAQGGCVTKGKLTHFLKSQNL